MMDVKPTMVEIRCKNCGAKDFVTKWDAVIGKTMTCKYCNSVYRVGGDPPVPARHDVARAFTRPGAICCATTMSTDWRV